MRIFLFLFAAAALMQCANSFAPMGTTTPSRVHIPRSVTSLAVTPDHLDAFSNMASAMDHFMSGTSTWLADAAADAPEKAGWWQSYLNIFKTTLLFVHDTIDAPLRSAGITQTWGIAIALFTAGIRSLLVPLSVQQSKASEYQKALKPYINEIKEKFKDNKDAQNRATAKLFEDANQNPLAGCLVSLVQLPVFLGLYRGVRLLAQEGQINEPFLWIPSLQGPVTAPTYRGMEWLTQGWTQDPGGFPVPHLGWETTLAYLVMPVLLVLGQSFTMSVLTPPPDDRMSDEEKESLAKSQTFLKFLPLMIGYFSLQVPAGLTIYWITSNAFTLLQTLAVRAYYTANPPKIVLPDYWDSLDDMDAMTADERREAAKAGISTGPSLEDLMDEAKFHYVVQRMPLRSESAAWGRVEAAGTKTNVPEAMSAWVASDTSSSDVAEEISEPASVETSTA